ncbi:MAG: chemotaxis protein CheB [Microcoleaceae cyanobacterium MO_207.B10]|nr:chemotaxis protein CheB [Microcoleaceae cyanobacterium MO_207.B10]
MINPKLNDFFVVGIGASAGGLRVIEEFFDNMPRDSGAAFVVVQHLSPDFKSLMKELLERLTQMEVHRVEEVMKLEPNNVYLIPPRKNLVVNNRCLRLTEQDLNPRLHPNYPISLFFDSLAKDYADKAIGVVLSGSGSDGAPGLQSINNVSRYSHHFYYCK